MKVRKLHKRILMPQIGDTVIFIKNYRSAGMVINKGEKRIISKIHFNKFHYAFEEDYWWYAKEFFRRFDE